MSETTREYFSEEFVQFKSNVSDWKDAIQVAAQPLLKNKIINQDYINEMIQNVLTMGDYIVIVPKVAMPHARPEAGAKDNGVSVLKLDEPVIFGKDKEVFLIICLATKDSSNHLKVLQQVSAIIDEETKVASLLNIEDKKQFINVANHYVQEEEEE